MTVPQQYTTNPVLDSSAAPTLVREETRQGSPHDDKHIREDDSTLEDGKSGIIADKSRGVVEMETLKEGLTTKKKVIIYGFFCVLAYVLSLSE